MSVLVESILGWLLSKAGGAAGARAGELAGWSAQLRTLDRIVDAAIEPALESAVAADQREPVGTALREHLRGRWDLDIDDVADLDAIVRRWLAPLTEPAEHYAATSYLENRGVHPHRLSSALAGRIRRGMDDDARRNGPLKPLVDELRHRETLRRLDAIGGGNGDAAHSRFERNYLRYLLEALGSFELFGVARGRVSERHSYAEAYVGLAVARTDSGSRTDDDELTGAGVEAASAFAEAGRVILRGGAGAGKTTLSRWLAVGAAQATLEGTADPWGNVVPFFLQLRRLAEREPPMPGKLLNAVAEVIAGEAPDGWVRKQFRDGRALLLVDGVDELVAERRVDVRAWLEVTGHVPDNR
jgi:hypothetical protein